VQRADQALLRVADRMQESAVRLRGVQPRRRGCVMLGCTWLESRGVMPWITAGADAGSEAAATRLSSGVPRSTRPRGRAVWRCLLAGVSDGCFFLISPSDDYSFSIDDCGSGRPPFIQVPSVLPVLPLDGWQSW
jgi:hypothetical protein